MGTVEGNLVMRAHLTMAMVILLSSLGQGLFQQYPHDLPRQRLSLSGNNTGRDITEGSKEEEGKKWNLSDLPFYKRMLRGMLESYMDPPDHVEDSKRKLMFQNKILARVGRSKSKFFRLA